eukprot:TRINITY_DN5937_c0_g1_i1.p2 TRINITY_DN5937_c0_g1~~TRINITY_DN5937_c0_g1_i1.p2  ORF type:complete len:117 (-),score=2.81 TRINITY_DN5937_c0_g1_i1:204-554(-)
MEEKKKLVRIGQHIDNIKLMQKLFKNNQSAGLVISGAFYKNHRPQTQRRPPQPSAIHRLKIRERIKRLLHLLGNPLSSFLLVTLVLFKNSTSERYTVIKCPFQSDVFRKLNMLPNR